MAYADIYDVAINADHVLRKQTAVAMHKQSLVVLAEDPQTEDHPQRVAFAQRVLNNPVAAAAMAIWRVLENGTIAADPAAAMAIWRVLENGTIAADPAAAGDGLVSTVVANAWNTLSKVRV